ncbi:Ubiquitin-like protease domain-containing protein [Abeliophyllum distichum]|uniref:Ubiquitin-like protease domain-containing protein n=1 Tax=Abeliophyllum distichum TaxID=126358 RepID=A0ABD1UJI9_9LAMI
MLGWEQPKRLTSSEVVNVLESKELEVISTLIPTEVELEEVYWKELTPCVEEEDTNSQDSKGNDIEHNGESSHSFHQHSPRVSQPPPVCHDHNIADVVRMEMEKLEERFHSTTSAYDSPIRNTTNVPVSPPKMKRKEEAGPNDVMDELEKERIIEDEDGEELVGGEKAADDENVSNETEFVEKRNVWTGASYQEKSTSIVFLLHGPEKEEKVVGPDVYDPYREVDPSKVDDLNKWMDVASTSDLVPLHHCDVEAKYLLDLLNKDAHGEWQIHAQSPRKEEFKFSKYLLKYVDGSIPELGKSWKDCRYLYAPCCAIDSHWFAVKIDLEDKTIFIFDSLKSHVRKAELEAFMKPLQVVITILMKLHVKCDDSYSTEKFKFVKMKEVHQQHNGSDCGIFTVKYIEFLQANMDVCAIRPEYIPMWRKKLAAELLA